MTSLRPCLACLFLLGGCAHPPSALLLPQGPIDRSPRPSESALAAAAALASPVPPTRPPERIALPSDYRLILLDGSLVLLRDGGAAGRPIHLDGSLPAAGAVVRQPSLLPQELAAEARRSQEVTDRLERELQVVLARSHDLEEEAQALGRQSESLAALLTKPAEKPPAASPAEGAKP